MSMVHPLISSVTPPPHVFLKERNYSWVDRTADVCLTPCAILLCAGELSF